MEKGLRLPEGLSNPSFLGKKGTVDPTVPLACLSSGSQASGLAVFPLGPVEGSGDSEFKQ